MPTSDGELASSASGDFDFLVVIDEKLFTSRLGMLSKDRGMTHAQQIHRKFSKKVGATKVISLTEANEKKLRRRLYPAPKEKLIYRRHPYDSKRIIGVRHFHETLCTEKRQNFHDLFRSIGAKEISWDKNPSWNRVYKTPDSLQADLLDLKLACKRYKYLKSSKEWQEALQMRLTTWCNTVSLIFQCEDSFSVDDESIDVLMEKLEATNRERNELLGEPQTPRSTENLRSNQVYKLFSSIRDTVHIKYFSKEDYKNANRKWVRKNWGVLHVHAYLNVIGLPQYANAFRSKSVEGHALLELGTKEILMQTFYMSAQDASMLVTCIEDLGNLESITILADVSAEVEVLREHGATDSTGPTVSITDSIANFFGLGGNSSNISAAQSRDAKSIVSSVVNKYRKGPNIPADEELLAELGNLGVGDNSTRHIGGGGKRQGSREDQPSLVTGEVGLVVPAEDDWVEPEEDGSEFVDSADEDSAVRDEDNYEQGDGEEDEEGESEYNPKSSIADSETPSRRGRRLGRRTSDYDAATSFVGAHPGRQREGRDSGASSFVGNEDAESHGDRSDGSSFIGYKNKAQSVTTDSHGEDSYDDEDDEEQYESYGSSRSGKSRLTSVSRNYQRQSKRRSGRRRRSSRNRRRDDYDDDILDGEEMTYKVVMVGIVGVGKKSLMKRFGGAEFSSSEISKMSKHFISSDVDRYLIKTWDDKGMAVRDQLMENRRAVLPFTKSADILMVVYDITNMVSFKYLPDILEQIVGSGTTPWMSMVLVGNKLDLDRSEATREVSTDMAFDLCRRFGFNMCFETSAKTGANVTELLSVALSRCEQDRLRELSMGQSYFGKSHMNTIMQDEEPQLEEPVSFARNIANFFGIGASSRRRHEDNSMGGGPGTYYNDDDRRTAYSSQHGVGRKLAIGADPSALAGAGPGGYRVVRRAQSAPKTASQSQNALIAYRGAGPPTATSFAPGSYFGKANTQTSFSPMYGGGGQPTPTETSFAPGYMGGTQTSFAPGYAATQTSFAPNNSTASRQRPQRGGKAFVV